MKKANKIAQWVKTLAAIPDSLSLIPGTHGQKESTPANCLLTSIHVPPHRYICGCPGNWTQAIRLSDSTAAQTQHTEPSQALVFVLRQLSYIYFTSLEFALSMRLASSLRSFCLCLLSAGSFRYVAPLSMKPAFSVKNTMQTAASRVSVMQHCLLIPLSSKTLFLLSLFSGHWSKT